MALEWARHVIEGSSFRFANTGFGRAALVWIVQGARLLPDRCEGGICLRLVVK